MIKNNLRQLLVVFSAIIIISSSIYSLIDTQTIHPSLSESTTTYETTNTSTNSPTCTPTYRTYGELVSNQTVSRAIHFCDAGYWYMFVNESASSMEIVLERVPTPSGIDEAVVYVIDPNDEHTRISTMNITMKTIDNPAPGQWDFDVGGYDARINLTVIVSYVSPPHTISFELLIVAAGMSLVVVIGILIYLRKH